MYINIRNVLFLCITTLILLSDLLPVNSATIHKNVANEKKFNLTCLQMETWDCFNLNKGNFQTANKDIIERIDGIIVDKKTTLLVKANNTDTNLTDKATNSTQNVVHPYFFEKSTGYPGQETKTMNSSSTHEDSDLGHQRSSRTSRKLGYLSKEETEDISKVAAVKKGRFMKMADSFLSSSFRTARISRKMWLAILSGIVLKFASLMPIILGKFALLGTVSILASKLSLLIVAIMAMRQLFTADVNGFGGFPDLGFGGHHQAMGQHQHYQPHMAHAHYPQAVSAHYPQAVSAHAMQSYHPVMAMSYANLQQTASGGAPKKWG